MLKGNAKGRASRAALAASLLAGALAIGSTVAAAEPQVTVTVLSVRAIDKVDEFSKGDFYARVTINDEVQSTKPIKQANIDKPDWKLSQKVKAGEAKVRVEILDKDVTADDPIDINRVDNKRALDFTINTKSCRVSGFNQTYRCGATIARTGAEKKAAEIKFKVDVK